MKKIITPIIVTCLMTVSAQVYAAEIESVVVSDFDNSIITVTGSVEKDEEGVSVVVLKKGEKLTDGNFYPSGGTIQSADISDSKFTSSFKFTSPDGVYEVHVSNGSKAYEFEFINKQSVLDFIADLGDKEISKENIYEDLKRYGASIGIDISFAKTDYEKSYLSQNILDYASRIKEQNIDGVKNVAALTKSELEFMSKLKEAPAASSVNTLISEYSKPAEIDVGSYNSLTNNKKSEVCLKFVEKAYTDMKTFRADFEKAVEDAEEPGGGTGGTGGTGSSGKGGNVSAIVSKPDNPVMPVIPEKQDNEGTDLLKKFTDLDNVEWAWEPILYMVDNGIMNGIQEGKFDPNGTLKREQFAKIMTIAFGFYDEYLTSDFIDVDKNDWAYAYISSAKAAGIINGIEENRFGYGMPVSRQDICVVIYRAAKNAGYEFKEQSEDFTDFDQVSDYAKEAVSYMAGSGIISGMGDGTFLPKATATRAQAAKLVYAVLGGDD